MTNFFSSSSGSVVDANTELKPSFGVALGVIALGASIGFIQPWISIVVGLFGVFLLIQTVVIRLVFTASDLEVYRNQELIRSFPYEEWQNWRIFFGPFPVLFYFKEVKSIHFLPMLFSSKMLKGCLEKYNLPQT